MLIELQVRSVAVWLNLLGRFASPMLGVLLLGLGFCFWRCAVLASAGVRLYVALAGCGGGGGVKPYYNP
eukprot:5649963-Prymnesium_polylepis.1